MSDLDLSLYAGRWVALAHGRVSGVGQTGVQALRAARRNQPKEKKLHILYVQRSGGEPLALSPLLDQLAPLLAKVDMPVYLVGGAVRDALLNQPSDDLDFAVPQKAIKLAFRIANNWRVPAYALDKKRDVGRVVLDHTSLDFVAYRGANLTADLRDRDFTINAMALLAVGHTTAELVDPFHGRNDLAAQLIRQVHPHSLTDDPVRGLRALRFSLQYGFKIESATEASAKTAVRQLHTTSIERVRDEWLKLMRLSPHQTITQLHQWGVLDALLPQVAALNHLTQSPPHQHNTLQHTIRVLYWLSKIEAAIAPQTKSGLPQLDTLLAPYASRLQTHLNRQLRGQIDGRLALRLAALYHDTGKATTRTVDEQTGRIRFLRHEQIGAKLVTHALEQWRLSKEATAVCRAIVQGHMRPLLLANQPQPPTKRAIFRFFQKYPTQGIDIALHALADHLGTYESATGEPWQKLATVVQTLLHHHFDQPNTAKPKPFLTGHDLIEELNIPPGKEIGRLLRLVLEAQAIGEVTTRAEALAWVAQTSTTPTPPSDD